MSQFTNENIVQGTVDANVTNASIAVTGPLTDTQLRATDVDVNLTNASIPVTDNGGSLTVDGTVAVSGSVAVTGPLTDTQLRATPVPVTIPTPVPVTQGGVATAVVTRVAVSTTVATLKAANSARAKLIIFNESGTLYVKYGSGATATDYTTVLTANAVLFIDSYTGIVTAIKASGSTNAQVTEIA
jgi:hypothetical protein